MSEFDLAGEEFRKRFGFVVARAKAEAGPCPEAFLLLDYSSGFLGELDRQLVKAHIDACGRCAAVVLRSKPRWHSRLTWRLLVPVLTTLSGIVMTLVFVPEPDQQSISPGPVEVFPLREQTRVSTVPPILAANGNILLFAFSAPCSAGVTCSVRIEGLKGALVMQDKPLPQNGEVAYLLVPRHLLAHGTSYRIVVQSSGPETFSASFPFQMR